MLYHVIPHSIPCGWTGLEIPRESIKFNMAEAHAATENSEPAGNAL